MVAVKEFSWEEVASPDFANPARKAWREAVAEIAAKAKQTLPGCAGRVDRAVQIVLNGDVELLEGDKAKVASQSNGALQYFIVNGGCTCKDYSKAPSNWCKHRIAVGLVKRATPLAKRKLAQLDGASNGVSQPAPEPPPAAPATPTTPGLPEGLAPFIVHLHGKPFVQYTGLLALAHERGLVSLKAHFISVTSELALAEAHATFADGKTYEESADATPQNVGATVRAHFPRLALTRAKARTLRDALNINLVSLEELGED